MKDKTIQLKKKGGGWGAELREIEMLKEHRSFYVIFKQEGQGRQRLQDGIALESRD